MILDLSYFFLIILSVSEDIEKNMLRRSCLRLLQQHQQQQQRVIHQQQQQRVIHQQQQQRAIHRSSLLLPAAVHQPQSQELNNNLI